MHVHFRADVQPECTASGFFFFLIVASAVLYSVIVVNSLSVMLSVSKSCYEEKVCQ